MGCVRRWRILGVGLVALVVIAAGGSGLAGADAGVVVGEAGKSKCAPRRNVQIKRALVALTDVEREFGPAELTRDEVLEPSDEDEPGSVDRYDKAVYRYFTRGEDSGVISGIFTFTSSRQANKQFDEPLNPGTRSIDGPRIGTEARSTYNDEFDTTAITVRCGHIVYYVSMSGPLHADQVDEPLEALARLTMERLTD